MLLQIVVNLILGLAIYILWSKLKKPPQDDPRLSRGLQLLQSKIAVLEDLSDRTDVQVKQLTALLEQKTRQVQQKIEDAQKHMNQVDHSIERSREMAEIFQDKIPHEEIIERQNTIKYVRAARMAHEGASLAEIAQAVDLPMGEIEFIAKVNKDRLMFDQDALPEWARIEEPVPQVEESGDERILEDGAEDFEYRGSDLSAVFDVPKEEYASLQKLGNEFREACRSYETQQIEEAQESVEASKLMEAARKVTDKLMSKASSLLHDKRDESVDSFIEEPSQAQVAEKRDVNSLIKPHVPAEISESFVLDLDKTRDEDQPEDEGPEIIMPGEPSFNTTLAKNEEVGGVPSFDLQKPSASSDEAQTRFTMLEPEGEPRDKNGLRPREAGVREVAFPKINVNDYLG